MPRMKAGGLMNDVLTRYRFTVDEYHRMGEAGILPEDSRIELIAGDVVVREPIGAYHAGTVDRLTRLWTSLLGPRAVVRVQNPIELSEDDSEVQPDLTLLKPRADFYTRAHPVAADVLLLIEVADTSLESDRRVKIPLYSRAGIRDVWLVDLSGDRVEVHREPTPDGYRQVRTLGRGGSVIPEAFPGLVVAIADLLG
jgi:Uma2 family endonuclease